MNWLVVAALVCVLASSVHGASDAIAWCYHNSTCGEATWPRIAAPYCNGTRQSPINIVSADAITDSSLTAFNFTNYSNTSALSKIENTGKTVKVGLKSGVQISGGGLSTSYDSLQFHLHWGNGTAIPGSEHTVNGLRYPMELHIVNAKSSFNGNTTLAVQDSEGLAALGFLIEERPNTSDLPASWKTLASYLSRIPKQGDSVTITDALSLDELLDGVDRTRYYRYLGSLTTPACNEAVVWTVFKETIKVSKNLIDQFSTQLHIFNTTSSPQMVHVYRNVQQQQRVTQTSSASANCYSLGLVALSLALRKI